MTEEIIKSALINGIIKKQPNGTFEKVKGIISLTYISQFEKFVLAYGTNQFDAGFVLVEEYGNTWDLVK